MSGSPGGWLIFRLGCLGKEELEGTCVLLLGTRVTNVSQAVPCLLSEAPEACAKHLLLATSRSVRGLESNYYFGLCN